MEKVLYLSLIHILLDYKTDRVSDEKELVDKYHAQLDYYAKALEPRSRLRVQPDQHNKCKETRSLSQRLRTEAA